MKDIGERFKEKRESMGVKVREVCNDLGITEAQLENLEDGNINAFKDIFFLKELIKKYARYLDVDEEETINEFNEFVFDYTSKIPVKELTEQLKEIEEKEKEEKKVYSPYTRMVKQKEKNNNALIYIILGILIVIFIVAVVLIIKTGF